MIRYTTKHQWRMKESEAGEWVRFSEVEILKAEHEEEIAFREDQIDTLNADVSYYKERLAVYKAKTIKNNSKANFYKARLELLGLLTVTVFEGLGILICLTYTFGW